MNYHNFSLQHNAISPSSKVFATGRLNVGDTTKRETLAFPLITEAARVTKITIRLKAHATTTVRHRELEKVSTHLHPSKIRVWFSEFVNFGFIPRHVLFHVSFFFIF